jgi:hypothetical protein
MGTKSANNERLEQMKNITAKNSIFILGHVNLHGAEVGQVTNLKLPKIQKKNVTFSPIDLCYLWTLVLTQETTY